MKKNFAVPLLKGTLLSVAFHIAADSSIASPEAYLLDVDRVDADVQIPLRFDLISENVLDELGYELGFGSTVAFDGSRMIVGMPIAGIPNSEGGQLAQDGRIYIYDRASNFEVIPTSLSLLDAIQDTPTGTGQAARRFGRTIDASSGYLLVSVREGINDFAGAGVLLAQWDGVSDYLPKTRIYRPSSEVDIQAVDFGASLQVSPSHTIIGVPDLQTGSPLASRGGVYTARTGDILNHSDVETTNQLLVNLIDDSPSSIAGGRFGHSLALNGNLLVVGAPGETSVGALNAGRAHVYQWTGTQWNPLDSLDSANPEEDAQYGYSCDIVIDGDETVIVIGAPADTDANRSGLVEVWRRSGSGSFTREAILTDEDALDPSETRLPFSSFGFSVKALDKNNIVIGRVNSYDLRNNNQHDPDPGSEAFVDLTDPFDPVTTAYPYALEPSAFVFRYDDTEVKWEVHRPLVPSRVNTTRSWAGWSMDAVSDGDGGFIVALGDPLGSALQPGLGSVFLFDAFADPIDDFDEFGTAGSDGISDAWHIKQDIEGGFQNRLDMNGDGRVDVAPTDDECVRQIVLIVDASGSVESDPFNDEVFQLAHDLKSLFPVGEVEIAVLGIGIPFDGTVCSSETTVDGLVEEFSNMVPRRSNDNLYPLFDLNWVPEPQPPLGVSSSGPGDLGRSGVRFMFERSDFTLDTDEEGWGPATAIVAEHFSWKSSYRVIVPISDEPAFLGWYNDAGSAGPGGVDEAFCTALNANGVAARNGVTIYPLVLRQYLVNGSQELDFLQDTIDCAEIMTGEIGSYDFDSTCSNAFLYSVGTSIQVQSRFTLSDQAISSPSEPTLADLLLALPEPLGCADCADANGDGQVNLDDLNMVLTNFGQPVFPFTNGDVNGDGQVNLDDLNLVLTQFGTKCSEQEKSFSMSLTDPEELPVTIWLMLRDHPNADAWINALSQFDPATRKEDADDLKEWVDDWQSGSPE